MFPGAQCFENVFNRALLPAKILGLLPFSIREGKPKTSLLTLYSFSVVLLSTFLSYTFPGLELRGTNVFIASAFNLHRRIMYPLHLAINCAEVYTLRHNLSSVLLAMEQIHSNLVNAGGRPDYKLLNLGILFFITSCTAVTALELYLSKSDIPEAFLLLINGIVLPANLHSVISLLTLVESQFITLRHMLLRDAAIPDMPRSIIRFQLLTSSHCALITCCERINNIYHLQLLYILSKNFIASCLAVSFTFFFIRASNFGPYESAKISHCILIVVNCFTFVLLISNRCTNVREEADKFNTLLHQLMIGDKTNQILNNEKLRLHVAVSRGVTFTAFGFFTIDYELIHSMVASLAIYLMTLIQFCQPSTGDSQPSNLTNFV